MRDRETTTTTSSNDTTLTTGNNCSGTWQLNSNIDFANIVNVQKFLNRYGFNTGDEDGFLVNKLLMQLEN